MSQEIANSTLIDTWASSGAKINPDISKIMEGWQLGEQPPHEYMNWLQNTFGSKLNHILKNGVAKWNDETEYLSGATIQHNGSIWICQETNVNSEPTELNNNWDKIPSIENLALTVDTIDDFPTGATTGDTCIVKDLDRGGIFIYDATQSAVNNGGTIFDGWIRQYSGAVNVKWFGAKGDGITNNDAAIQNAINYLSTIDIDVISNGDGTYISANTRLSFPLGIYRINTVIDANSLSCLIIEAEGKTAIIGNTTSTKGNNFIYARSLRYLNISNIHFQNFNKVFDTQTNNLDLSNWDFVDCQVSAVNCFIDSGSYVKSRSTIVNFTSCIFQYSVIQICKLYVDSVNFINCWIGNGTGSTDSIYVNSKLTIQNCMFIPAGTHAIGKSFIKFTNDNGAGGTTNDYFRGVNILNSRVSNEGGNCPLVVCDYPLNNINNALSPVINIENCDLNAYSEQPYQSGNTESGIVYLIKYPSAINFKGCAFTALGSAKAKLVAKSDALLNSSAPKTFGVYLDEQSFNSAARAAGESSTHTMATTMREFINNPSIYTFRDIIEGGHLKIQASATTGRKKSTFTINSGTSDSTYATPIAFMLVLGGAGDSSYNNYDYEGTSIYMVTIGGAYTTNAVQQITFTKLHGNTFAVSNAANCDIVSMHFGTAETGSTSATAVASQSVTVTFGTRLFTATAKIIPLFSKYNQYFLPN